MNVLQRTLQNIFGCFSSRPANQKVSSHTAPNLRVPHVRTLPPNQRAAASQNTDEAIRATQKAQILAALVRGEQLTKLEMLRRFGTLCGTQRIHELRREGHPIHTQLILVKKNTKIAIYSLKK